MRKDIRDLAQIKEIGKFNKMLEVLAAQSGNLLNVKELANTCRLSEQTVGWYLFILENTYILKLIHPYSKNIRSELFKVPKIYFYDSGLMQMLWLKRLQKEIVGNVFETSIFSELVKKYGKENVLYWRTKDKKEIDFILRKENTILPIEAKSKFERFDPTAVLYFGRKYNTPLYNVVSLYGERGKKECVYPWEI